MNKYIVLGVSIVASMYTGSLIVPAVSVFDLPRYLTLHTDINSYFFQGLCAALASTLVNLFLKLPKYALFNVSLLVALLMFVLQSVRAGDLDLYFAQYSVLPFLVGVASCLFVVGYVQHLTSKGKATR